MAVVVLQGERERACKRKFAPGGFSPAAYNFSRPTSASEIPYNTASLQ